MRVERSMGQGSAGQASGFFRALRTHMGSCQSYDPFFGYPK